MDFLLNANTEIICQHPSRGVENAVDILRRDINKRLRPSDSARNTILLTAEPTLKSEEFSVEVGENITVRANDGLGFIYGLLYISQHFLGIHPFWFWMDQKIEKTEGVAVPCGQYRAPRPAVKYRGWFINDEVLIAKWNIDGDSAGPWRMAFEALLRCGGNMVIPGTDQNSRIYRRLASDMGLWITHHHAEPLGAEMFVRRYPELEPNYAEKPELFHKLWEEGIQAQKDCKVIWILGFRGQGDCPFWTHDTSGQFDTPAKRGRLISQVIKLQRQLVLKYVEKAVFCTNLYGEVMELYQQGHITLAEDIIQVSADNGYGKMVTRRRDNHTVRVPSLPKEPVSHGGIYYHVSFYDLQAANHITMLPNSVDFVDRELTEAIRKNAADYWIVNCSNIRPHVYYLDAVRKKWFGERVSDKIHSQAFADTYYGGDTSVAQVYRDYPKAMLAYGSEEDEHAGEQFYTENIRLLIHAFFNEEFNGTPGLKWLVGECPLDEQVKRYTDLCRKNMEKIAAYYDRCQAISNSLDGDRKKLFDATLFLHVSIHFYCTRGTIAFGNGYARYREGAVKDAFITLGDSAREFDTAAKRMRTSEYGVWKGFYFNDCFADVKHTAFMIKKLMGYVRERGDNARHDLWYRDAVYAPEDRHVFTQLVRDNHMTDWELYEAFKIKEGGKI